MSLKITFLGHSGFLFSDGTHTLAVDPFLTGNPVAKHAPTDIAAQFIALSHGHQDHVGDSLEIAKSNNANVIGAFEICNYFTEQGHENVNPANPGGQVATDFGWVALTQAFHSSSFEGQYMGMPCGLMIHMAGKTVYHMGDTTIFGDMKLLGEIYSPDLTCVPIGDRFTMGPAIATRAAELVGAAKAVPIHYDTWPPIAQDPADFSPDGVEVIVMEPGGELTLD